MRVTLIHNPRAARHTPEGLRKLMRLLANAGHQVRSQSVKNEDWEKALHWPTDIVAVAGGDGTVARVARRLVGRTTPIAPLPSGTANNVSRTLGLVERPFEELVHAWPRARRVKLDIGLAKGPWGERHFVEGVGAGLFARLLSAPKSRRKRIERKPPAESIVGALRLLEREAGRCRALELKLTLDGKDLSGRYVLAEAINIPYVGPNLFLAPDKQPGDGSFELVLVAEAERGRLKNYLASWQENRERLSVLPSHRGRQLQIEWTGFGLHIDDELWPEDGEKAPRPAGIDLTIAGQVEFLAPGRQKRR